MKIKINDLEVRGKEKKQSSKGNDYIIARCEDETGKLYEFYDPNLDNFEYYQKGQMIEMSADLTQYRGNWQLKVISIKHQPTV